MDIFEADNHVIEPKQKTRGIYMKKPKKNLTLYQKTNNPLWFVKWEHGGEVPRELKGGYTSVGQATAASERYLDANE